MTDASRPKPKQPLWRIVLAIVVFAVVMIAVRYGAGLFDRRTFTTQAAAEKALDEAAETEPVLGHFKALFPEDWPAFRAGVAADYRSTPDQDALKRKSADRIRTFMARHIDWTVAAPPAELNAALTAERVFIEQLQRDNVQHCAAFGMTGLRGDEAMSRQAEQLATEAGVAKLTATRAGRDRPFAHDPATDADGQAVFDGMSAAGASPEVIQLMASGGAGGAPEQLCAGSVALYRSIDAMPDDQAARVFGSILADVAKTQPAPASN
jgi:hypothetical protein